MARQLLFTNSVAAPMILSQADVVEPFAVPSIVPGKISTNVRVVYRSRGSAGISRRFLSSRPRPRFHRTRGNQAGQYVQPAPEQFQ